MYKILYVHGLGGSKNGGTGNALKELAQKYFNDEVKVITEDFPLDPTDWISKIKRITKKNKIDCIVSSSLGAFMTIYASIELQDTKIILINPALTPDIDLRNNFGYGVKEYRGKREDGIQTYTLDNNLYTFLKYMTIALFQLEHDFKNVTAVFSDNDEFFHHMPDYQKHINQDCFMIENATHHFKKDDLEKYIIPIIQKELTKRA